MALRSSRGALISQIGPARTAEIGAMRISDEIDALEGASTR
jgi:ABC-type transporter Mla maintaining outer membrane lipid asymmetry permease subunit MlaE